MAALHAILASIGTDGDVYPFVALGAVLRRRGYRVTMVANEPFRPVAAEHDLEFAALISAEETHEVLSHPDFWHPLKGAWVVSRWGTRFVGRQYALLAELTAGEGTVLVASPAVAAARLIQEKLSKPLATVLLQPWIVPSLHAPPVMPAGLTLPRGTPRLLGAMYFRLIDGIGDALVGRAINRVRAHLGLGHMRRIFRWWFSPQLVIGLFPEWYGPPQADWPPQIRLAGFPMSDGRADIGLPASLEQFLDAGEPPIAFTFGTGMMHGAKLFAAAVQACRRIGVRGVLVTKYRRQLPRSLPPSVHHCQFAPFLRLFPKCAAVVHHGGVGTVAKALGAGTPQLVLPLAFDQLDNAMRVARLGAGEWLSYRQRSPAHIAGALSRLITPEARERNRRIARRFSDNDALETAADWVEACASGNASITAET